MTELRCGDTVTHRPTGETWTVAFVDGNELSWVGWPFGFARTADCEVRRRCTDAEHVELLLRIAQGEHDGGDYRPAMAWRDLEAFAATLSKHADLFDILSRLSAVHKLAASRLAELQQRITETTEQLRQVDKARREALLALVEAEFPSAPRELATTEGSA